MDGLFDAYKDICPFAEIVPVSALKKKNTDMLIGLIFHMTEKEMIQKNIEEFSRLQKYMILTQDKESAAYKEMYERYVDLKAILNASGVNLTELDRIKE